MNEDAATIRAYLDEEANPLHREMIAARAAMAPGHYRFMQSAGIPADVVVAAMIGAARATVDRRDFWVPDEDGKQMIVTPLIEAGRTIDLIAFDPSEPNAWYLRTGHGWALGIDSLTAPYWPGDPAPVIHPTPLCWLSSGCEGACVSQWTDEARAAIRRLEACEVRSPEFARALRLELTRPPRIPEIKVARWQDRAA